ncbi:MAG: helix-turn-helix transcriptional regulator [Saprospiraceae bacterium]
MNPDNQYQPQSEFISQINDRLGDRLFDPELTVKKILRLVFMSRTDFHRKLKRETGLSATAYIRRERLTRARKLLLDNSQTPVNQVSQAVGFANSSYFSKKFKELFGCGPGELKKQSRKVLKRDAPINCD